jgi:hypothetical protein
MEEKSTEYKCNTCNKCYKTYQTLWKHNKKFHLTNNNHDNHLDNHYNHNDNHQPNLHEKSYPCRKCKKTFTKFQNRWRHEKKCTTIKEAAVSLEEKKVELSLLKEKNKNIQLQLKLQKDTDSTSVRKINKLLIKHSNLKNANVNSTVNSHNTNNTNVTNLNFNLIGFGKEDNILEVLTKKDIKAIMGAKYGSLEKFIEIVHCGEYDQFKNVLLTNINGNYMYKYDQTKNMFVLATKDDILNSLVEYRINDLEEIYNGLLQNNKLDNKTQECIDKMINKINDTETKHIDYEGKEHENYKEHKINEIKLLLFNNQEKITKDITSILKNDLCSTDSNN